MKDIEKFVNRRNNCPEQIDNAKLPAGSPMVYYCRLCGHESEQLPEDHWMIPRRYCKECTKMKMGAGLTDQQFIDLANNYEKRE